MKLTDLTVRAIPLTATGQRYYTDDAVRGLAVCVGTRTKTFTLIVRKNQRRKRHTLGLYDPPHFTLALAREKARDMLAAERLRKAEPPRITFEEALKIYYRIHVAKLRQQSQRGIRQTIDRRFRPQLGKKALADIKPTHIAPLLDTMIETPTEMHNAFAYLAMFLNWAMRRGYIETAPTTRMQTPPKPASRERTLSPEELAAVWRAADPDTDYGRIVRLCILSAQRAGQCAAVGREYIQTEAVIWPAGVMKANRSHMLPLTAGMRALLPDRIGLLFPSANARPFNNWSRNKNRLDKESGVRDFTHHDLRRTWATIAAEQLDIAPHIIDSILAHVSGTQVARIYNRAKYLAPMRDAMHKYETWLQTLLSNTESMTNGPELPGLHHERAGAAE
jgi:integrase